MIYQKDIDGIIDQGDILYPVKIKDYISWWIDDNAHPIIILTPTCDIAQDKVDHHRFSILQPFQFFFLKICTETIGENLITQNISNTKRKQIEQKITRTIKNSWPRYHFFPKDDLFSDNRFLDFEIVFSLPINVFKKDLRIARISSPYKEELIHRYSHHTMRIGTKDISKQQIDSIINSSFDELFPISKA